MNEPRNWGELDDNSSYSSKSDALRYTQYNFKENCLNFELPPLHQPSSQCKATNKDKKKMQAFSHVLLPPKDSADQNHLLHSIELQHHKRKMRCMLSAAHSHQVEIMKGSSEGSSLPSPPPPPKRFCSSEGKLKDKTIPRPLFPAVTDPDNCSYIPPLSFKHLEETNLEIDPLVNHQLLLKSVAAVCAHSGFENAIDVSLQALTDVASDYFTTLCVLFKRTHERSGGKDNVDQLLAALEHTLQEVGINSAMQLQQYWITRVGQVASKFEQDYIELVREYNSLKETSVPQRYVSKEEKG